MSLGEAEEEWVVTANRYDVSFLDDGNVLKLS